MNEQVDTLSDNESLAVEEQDRETLAEEPTDELEAEEAGSEDEETADGDDGTEEKPKKKGGFQRRIERLEREKFEAELRAEEAARQAREYQQYLQSLQQQQPGNVQPNQPMPKLADFDYDEAQYQQAVAQWHQQQLQGISLQQQEYQRQMAAQQEQQRRAVEFQGKIAAASEKYPDFMVKVQNPELPPLQQINPAAFEAVVTSDQFADVAYYLANNPSELYGFRGLDQAQTIRRVAKLEIELAGGKKTAIKAAPPAPPGKLSGKASTSKRVEDMSMQEYVEWRRQQGQN